MIDTDDGDLVAALGTLSRGNVLVVGDLMLDRYVYGKVERVSPEAPVPIVSVSREIAMPGGAGNVVRNLTALDAATAFVSVVGDDQEGSDLTGLIGGQNKVEPWLLVENGRATTMKTRYIAAGQHLLRADREIVSPVTGKLADRLIKIATDAMAATSVTILSDYRKGVLGPDVARALIEAAQRLGRPVIVDPKGTNWDHYAGADVVTPNRKELETVSRMPVGSDAEVVAAARHVLQQCRFGAVLVTRSEDGMTLVTPEAERHYPAEADEVYDVSGAGDTVVAALAAGLAAGLKLSVAARIANLAGGIVVGKVGTAVARVDDLIDAVKPDSGALRKVVTRQVAAEAAERWRQRGWRVGFTNGCFDLLHPGHVHLLDQARDGCDRLIVGVNSDASVRRLKGNGRPVQPEAARAAVLASVAAVDLVVIFDEDTPLALLDAIRPDVLVKGSDYTRDTVVGAREVESWGGRVMLADIKPGHSTTATVMRLRG